MTSGTNPGQHKELSRVHGTSTDYNFFCGDSMFQLAMTYEGDACRTPISIYMNLEIERNYCLFGSINPEYTLLKSYLIDVRVSQNFEIFPIFNVL